jgi:hypothetical protein
MKGNEVRREPRLIVDVLGDILVPPICDVASCPWEFPMSLLCSFHTGVRTAMIYMHRLNRGGRGVRSPADSLIQWLSPSQLSWNYASVQAM